jgi:hypothetical protein
MPRRYPSSNSAGQTAPKNIAFTSAAMSVINFLRSVRKSSGLEQLAKFPLSLSGSLS